MKILIVCLGNICRSPMAEGILQHMADERNLNWQVASAGTNGIHTGEPPHRISQKVCRENGYNISAQRAMDFKTTDFKIYDMIYVMAKDVLQDVKTISGAFFDENKIDYFLNELYPGKNMDVTDPWYGGEEGYYEVFNQIEKTCACIVNGYTK